jgi:hypothetical protein
MYTLRPSEAVVLKNFAFLEEAALLAEKTSFKPELSFTLHGHVHKAT